MTTATKAAFFQYNERKLLADFRRRMLLQQLKERTREKHHSLENDLNIQDHINSVTDYCCLLESWYGWYAPWETMASQYASPEIFHFLANRWKTPMLERDLAALGAGLLQDLPRAEVDVPQDRAEWVGAMYVMEGSTLGGQLISRVIEEKLILPSGQGSSFFRSYGERVGPMWRQFREFAEGTVSPEQTEAAVRAAERTFDSIHSWLCRNPK